MAEKAFSLVELMIVVVIVALLASIVIFQIGMDPQKKARDSERKAEINTIADKYVNEAAGGQSFQPITGQVPTPPEGGSYQGLLSSASDEFKICAELEKGKGTNCLLNSDNPNCYCRSSHGDNGSGNGGYNNGGGNGGGGNPSPSPTIVPTVAPTVSPTPSTTPSNPWGQALTFAGVVAGRNPPSYTWINQFVETPYDTKMNFNSPNLTVEAWIKPNVPTASGYGYRIVDNTFRLTMDAQPNGQNVAYQYYFDVQSSTNGCGQTVVYSGHANWNPWDISNYKIVSQSEFTTWKHIAGVLSNGNLNIYENGIFMNSYNIGMTVCNDGRSNHIGAGMFGKNTPYYDFFQGAIDEVRVSKVARYTSNFTPQKTPFATDSNTMMLYHFDGNTNDTSSNSLNGSTTGSLHYVTSDIPY